MRGRPFRTAAPVRSLGAEFFSMASVLSVGPCLIPYSRKAGDAFAEGGFGHVERSRLNGGVEPL